MEHLIQQIPRLTLKVVMIAVFALNALVYGIGTMGLIHETEGNRRLPEKWDIGVPPAVPLEASSNVELPQNRRLTSGGPAFSRLSGATNGSRVPVFSISALTKETRAHGNATAHLVSRN